MLLIDGQPATEEEADALCQSGQAAMQRMLASLDWKPIAQYDLIEGPMVVLGDGTQWSAGFFGKRDIWYYADGSTDFGDDIPDTSPMWRRGRDHELGGPLGWMPPKFAIMPEGSEWMILAD